VITASFDIPAALWDYVDVEARKHQQYAYFIANITLSRVPSYLNDTAHIIRLVLADETHRAFYD